MCKWRERHFGNLHSRFHNQNFSQYTNLSQKFFTSVVSDKNSKDDTKEEETEEKVN